jgi:D-hydroxyproline dehydrogenase subunit beta
MTNLIGKIASPRSNLGHRHTGKTTVARPERPDFCPEISYITNRRPKFASSTVINPSHSPRLRQLNPTPKAASAQICKSRNKVLFRNGPSGLQSGRTPIKTPSEHHLAASSASSFSTPSAFQKSPFLTPETLGNPTESLNKSRATHAALPADAQSLYCPHAVQGALATSTIPSYDVVVAGAGIVGTACALEFARSGLSVAIVEPAEIGGGATAAGMGHLAVMDDSPAQFALTSYSQSLWKQLSSELPPDVEYLPCGSLWVAADEMEMDEVHRKFAYYAARNIAVEILDEQALREAEPNLRPGLAGGLLLSDDAVIYPPCAARYLFAEARRHGAELLQGQTILNAGQGIARLDKGISIAAGNVVLATGTAARNMIPGLDLQPRKGHLIITDRYPGFVNHQLIELGYLKSAHSLQSDSVAFNVQPRKTGQLLIGSSRQYGLEDPAIESLMLSNMLRRAVEYMPALTAVSAIRGWTGFRAATPDKLPLIGACPDLAGVYLATGHEGLGISTSLATAKLLADLLLNRESAIPREPYAPTRSFAHA